MNNYLSGLTTTIIPKNNNIYDVIYTSPSSTTGTCTYTKWITKLQPHTNLILINSNMGDILTYINDKSPLNDGDLIHIQRVIREHSLNTLSIYLHQ